MEGDKNTKFSHLKASLREKKNIIWGVMNQQNVWIEDKEEIDKEFCKYFMNHFATSIPIDEQIETTIAGLVPKMNSDMKDQLDLSFTEEEVQHLFPKYDQPSPLDLMDCQQHFFKSIGLSKA